MPYTPEELRTTLEQVLGAHVREIKQALGETTLTVAASHYVEVMQTLRDHPSLAFDQLMDLCGIDYSAYREGDSPLAQGPRYAVVCHLLSLSHNARLRVRVWATNDDMPILPSINPIYSSANWYEREAFDLYGIIFEGHDDLRRILTDYGFIGHPMRKDFPVSGHVEMRYDPEQKRVIYQPVSIEPREITPRIIREDGYAGMH